MSINSVALSGNLTRNPELRHTAGGTPVMSFSIAVNERRLNKNSNQWEDQPNFIDCTLWGKRAESLNQYLTKGSRISLHGKLHWSQWEKDGYKRSKLEVVVDEVVFMSQQGNAQHADAQTTDYDGGYDYYAEDIPF